MGRLIICGMSMRRTFTNRFAASACGLLLLLFAISVAAAQKGILWRIDGGAARPSYLLGTIHSDDERVTRLPTPVAKVFRQADSFTAEIKMDMPNIMQSTRMMFFTDETRLDALIDPRSYRQLVSLLADYGMPEFAVQKMKPWAAAATLSLPKPKTGVFLDMMLYNQAVADGKAVYGLETVAEQVGSMEAIPQEVQIAMLKDAIRQHPQINKIVDQLIKAYLARDLKKLESISQETMQQGDHRVVAAFNEELLVKRNRRMLKRMLPRIEEGNAFIAVGAMHLPGETGLLQLLRQQGYRVTAVY